jgi:hypothetical protein
MLGRIDVDKVVDRATGDWRVSSNGLQAEETRVFVIQTSEVTVA